MAKLEAARLGGGGIGPIGGPLNGRLKPLTGMRGGGTEPTRMGGAPIKGVAGSLF